MRLWAENLDLVTPLDPRDAFFGGRAEAVRAHCQAQRDQHIFYDGFTSLYKRVLDATTGMTYPYGYQPTQDIVDDMTLSILSSDDADLLDIDEEEDMPFIPGPCH